MTVAADPPVSGDGRCVQCGGERRPGRSRRYGIGHGERDPFCSVHCCRAWHQLEPVTDARANPSSEGLKSAAGGSTLGGSATEGREP